MPTNPVGDFIGLDPDYDRGPIVVQWRDLGNGAAAKVIVAYESRQYVWNTETLAWERYGAGGVITIAYDYVGGSNVIYEGHAPPGSSKAAAVWQIRKFTYSGTNVTDIQWAAGTGANNQIWNNRAALAYS